MLLNRQRQLRLSLRRLHTRWRQICAALAVPEDAVTVCLVGTRTMARWNRQYRGRRGPTDVLSFPTVRRRPQAGARSGALGTTRGRADGYLGDIAIAPRVAQEQARRRGHSLTNELSALMLHGLLHLLGYDHETDRGQMRRLEQRLRRQLGLS